MGTARKAQTVAWMGVHALIMVKADGIVVGGWGRGERFCRCGQGYNWKAGPMSSLILRQRYSLSFGISVFFVMSSLLSPLHYSVVEWTLQ